ncbi:helix-turn-helix domain-containing protein [Burkholderia multivorans]|uniref:helix-turn-helix domain-containing protein n=1 Tax=Burkholderia multivorans TaxID=87883 RepID=UPI001C27B626|nr:helix-turn-helix transcriptional regulator [Burkholderia multivorans]MBU9566272.1 helix-turn-helix domain-containing protein [Burkholderia multivorans]
MNGPLKFGERLQALRRERGMSRRDLCRALEAQGNSISREALGQWERREVYPGFWHLIHLARFFNISIDTLVDPHCKENPNGTLANGR